MVSFQRPHGRWSVLCPGLTLEVAHEAIKAFSKTTHLPVTSQPFVSASSDNGVTISDLFSDDDIASILSTTSPDHWAAQIAAIPTISSATGEFIWAGNFRSLLRAAVDDISIKALRWDKISQRLGSIAGSARGVPVIMHQIAVSADVTVRAAVKQQGCDAPLVLDKGHSSPQSDFFNSSASKIQPMAKTVSNSSSTGRPDKSKIAVIGASGYFRMLNI